MALEDELADRPSHVQKKPRSTRALLEEAQELAVRIESLLGSPVHDGEEACAFRLRLARAHTLGLLDQLEELVGPAFGRGGPGLRDCRSSDPVESGERGRTRGARS